MKYFMNIYIRLKIKQMKNILLYSLNLWFFLEKLTPEGLPDLCNEFYGEFMEPNDFFGIDNQEEKNEIIEIIQHFCIWLFKNDYTKSKLSLASSN